MPTGLMTFVGKNEIPRELESWRNGLPDSQNPALALRWAAALAEMEPTLEIEESVRFGAIKEWRGKVVEKLGTFENLDYFSAAEDTDSIVSLRIKHPETGKWMVKSELSKVFKAATLDMSEKFPNDPIAKKVCFTGQPVLISKD